MYGQTIINMATRKDPARIQLTLARNMKSFRKELNLSQMQLAERCGVSTSFIGEIEICRKFPAPRVLESIANSLGMKTYQLLYDGEGDELDSHRSKASIASFAQDLREKLDADIRELTKVYISANAATREAQVAERPVENGQRKPRP